MSTMEKTKRQLQKEQELQKEGLLPLSRTRPTRSSFKAPPIPPLPKTPLEHAKTEKSFKDVAKQLEQFKIDKAKREQERQKQLEKERKEFEKEERKREKELREKMFSLD